MQLKVIGPQQGMEKPMRWHTESSLKEHHARHDVFPHRSKRCRILGHKKVANSVVVIYP
jgi:hypothetical protein